MRRAVRRLTWILLSLAMMTVAAFGLLAELLPAPDRSSELPLFFNPAPRNVRDLSLAALARVARPESAPRARAELVRLGGAALPFVLPELEQLPTEARQRVALALAPLAARMGAAEAHELDTGEEASAFWARFWQDRAVDFREPVVRRLVTRLSQRSLTLRREDVLSLDTYALPALMRALGRVRTEDDVRRVQRLIPVLEHVTSQPFGLDHDASVEEARLVVRRWRLWWDDHGADFTPLDGPRRLAAMAKETAYGRWLSSVLRGEIGRLLDGRTGLDLLRGAAPLSLPGFLGALALAHVGGALVGSRQWVVAARPRSAMTALTVVVAALPFTLVLAVLGAASATALTLSLALGLAYGALVTLPLLRPEPGGPAPFAERLGAKLALSTATLASGAPFVAALQLGAECALGLPGLGVELSAALARADLHAVMAVALACSVAAAALLLAGDALHALITGAPRPEPEEAR